MTHINFTVKICCEQEYSEKERMMLKIKRTKITLLAVVILITSGCQVANQLASGLSGGVSGGGIGSSLSSGGDFDDIGSDFAGENINEKYTSLNNSFNNVQNLKNQRSSVPGSVAYSYFEVVKSLHDKIDRNNVNDRDENGKTPLVAAIENNDAAMVKFLIDRGATVDDSAIAAAQNTGNAFIIQALEK